MFILGFILFIFQSYFLEEESFSKFRLANILHRINGLLVTNVQRFKKLWGEN